MADKLFARTINPNDISTGAPGIGRPLWDEEAYKELNTYRSYNPIGLIVEPLAHGDKEKDYDFLPFKQAGNEHMEGRHSLFNAVNAVGNNLRYQVEMNAPLMDTPNVREEIRKRSDCSVKALVDASARGEMGRAVYSYADFMFCKHLGRISNNYLITLRRFPFPAGDHINYTIPGGEKNWHMPDIGRLVTWMGTPGNDMSGILKYDINLPYKEMTANIQTAQYNADNSGGFLGGLMNMASGSYRNGMLSGKTGDSGISFIQKAATPFGFGKFTSGLSGPPDNSWAYHRDENKVYGPVDAITKTYYRQGAEDGGIKFEHNITLTFDYELRSFDGINTRAAFLDLLANILAVTFTNAQYWGGAVRGTGAAQSNVFANLPIFHMKEPLTWSGITDSIFGSIGEIGKSFNSGNDIKSAKDVLNAASNLLKGVFTGIAGGLLNKLGRPQKSALNSLINFAPTGLWHLTIGNPRHPIMSMGNMILDNCSIEHYGPLGLDDFPTGLRVTITLKHGTPRDNLKIEHMYMNGDFRIYQPLGNTTYMAWQNATEINAPESMSTYSLAEDIDKVPEGTPENTENAGVAKSSSDRVLMKYFGTTNKEHIITAGKEGYFGAQPNSLKSKSDSGQQNNKSNNKKKK